MSAVASISTVALPSSLATSFSPSHSHAREGAWATSLTTLSLRHSQASGGGSSHQAALFVHDVRLAEQESVLHVNDPADSAKTSRDHRADEIDLQLDGGVPETVFLEGRQRHAHRRVRDLRDDAALHHTASVPVLRAGLELEHDAARLGFGDARAERPHPAVRRCRQQLFRAPEVLHPYFRDPRPRPALCQWRTMVFCLGAAAIARATSASSAPPDSSRASRFRNPMMRSRTRAASSNCNSFDNRRISFSRSRTIASRSSRGTPAPAISSMASTCRSFSLISSA